MEDSLKIKKGEINSKLIISASRIMDATNEKELLAILREVATFVGQMIDSETVEQEIKRQQALTPAEQFAEMTSG